LNRKRPNETSDIYIKGLNVEVKNNDIGRAMRKFKKLVQEDGILQEVKNRRFFEKPSVVKNRKKKAARASHLKERAKRHNELGF